MRIFLNFYIFFIFLFFLSCYTVLLDEFDSNDDFNFLTLRELMAYPELRISGIDLKKYAVLNDLYNNNFEFIKGDQEGFVSISDSSYNSNIEYIKKLYLYNKKLYKIIVAYSIVQGSSFKSEILKYFDRHNIKEKFPLRINVPFYRTNIGNKSWVVIKKNFLDMLIQDKRSLFVAKRKLENMLEIFSVQ
ncbi:putative lipoprotein (plasmid) [Borrelia duttonii Ly]|uniref:Lipoprotein n=4 Tax=Borrelia TaxID=138 RepID=W5SKU5_9SPIR|nr:hypothetical protein [Borrelia crocidurae]ACH93943.1 putative lipoprotein [Borrelia duttonii Ly]AFI32117.1 Putative lipoprotein [Borrelia crocidurae str. Achema]AHH07278.1 Hypothetical protein BCD_1212 [Borrelia crocidurae DOU]